MQKFFINLEGQKIRLSRFSRINKYIPRKNSKFKRFKANTPNDVRLKGKENIIGEPQMATFLSHYDDKAINHQDILEINKLYKKDDYSFFMGKVIECHLNSQFQGK
tara:strand:- start:105 stop:422 length:318 start_codon:yes stop_codon:yes gene_type:complete